MLSSFARWGRDRSRFFCCLYCCKDQFRLPKLINMSLCSQEELQDSTPVKRKIQYLRKVSIHTENENCVHWNHNFLFHWSCVQLCTRSFCFSLVFILPFNYHNYIFYKRLRETYKEAEGVNVSLKITFQFKPPDFQTLELSKTREDTFKISNFQLTNRYGV